MELTLLDFLKAQNRFLDTQIITGSIKGLKEFNNGLIKDIEFKNRNPTMWSDELTKAFVRNGLIYFGKSMGKSSSSYETPYKIEPKIIFGYSNLYEDMSDVFIYAGGKMKIDRDTLTPEMVDEFCEMARNLSSPTLK